MDSTARPRRTAVVGAGLAGLLAARWLSERGAAVEVFEKSRGPGGRLSTRRAPWTDANGETCEDLFDHGAPWFGARSAEFARALEALHPRVQVWTPRRWPGSLEPPQATPHWLVTPSMNAWCRDLANGLVLHTGHTVQALRRTAGAWVLDVAESGTTAPFDAVLLTPPPLQSAALLDAHRPDWSAMLRAWPMRPCWTLMGVTRATPEQAQADVGEPATGSLAWFGCQDARPGRARHDGHLRWVAQATPAWTEAHLDDEPASVKAALQQALAQAVGAPLPWQAAWVHRWRYAHAPQHPAHDVSAQGQPAWFDPALSLAVAGDAPGGGGVEGAWRSGLAAARALVG
jgi:hypothetical protein